jgi:hypothetical protein
MILTTQCCKDVCGTREFYLFRDCMSEIYSQSVFVWFVRVSHLLFERLVNSNMRNDLSLFILVM